jgi:hypothetical protein
MDWPCGQRRSHFLQCLDSDYDNPEDRTTFGTAVVSSTRCIADIVEGIKANGLEVL